MTQTDIIQVTQGDNHEVQKPWQHARKAGRGADAERSVQGLTWACHFLIYIVHAQLSNLLYSHISRNKIFI